MNIEELQPALDWWDEHHSPEPFIIVEAARLVANPPDASTIRSYFVANLMDGDEGGQMTISMKQLADDATEIVGFILEDWLVAAALTLGDTG